MFLSFRSYLSPVAISDIIFLNFSTYVLYLNIQPTNIYSFVYLTAYSLSLFPPSNDSILTRNTESNSSSFRQANFLYNAYGSNNFANSTIPSELSKFYIYSSYLFGRLLEKPLSDLSVANFSS